MIPRIYAALLIIAAAFSSTSQAQNSTTPLAKALTFHASFDRGLDADFAKGDATLRHASSMSKFKEGKPGLPETGEVQVVQNGGRFGHALRFTKKKSPLVFFHAATNVTYQTTNWNGTVSFWLNADPEGELPYGFCDPIQITPRAWNDAAFFVEFEKRTNDIPFRLAAYADYRVWNPSNKKWEDVTFAEKSLANVAKPPFAKGKWTHIVFTFENFNTGRDDGIAKLYLDGVLTTTLSPRRQTFTWDTEKCLIMLGVGYIGLWDELAVFDRAFTAPEVRQLHELKNGVKDLTAKTAK